MNITEAVKRACTASRWQFLKARLLGSRIKSTDGDYTICGWKYADVFYITKETYNKPQKQRQVS